MQKYVPVFMVPDYESLCVALVCFYKGDQKEVHNTFNRHYKEMKFHPNPQVVMLMGALPGVGEKRAEALIDNFGTVWNVLSSRPEELEEVDGIGKVLSKGLLRRVGRVDV